MLVAAAIALCMAPQAGAAVPAHGRGWELVSIDPPSSARVPGLWPVSSDGNQLIIATVGPPDGAQSGAAFNFLNAERGASGWSNTPIGMAYEGEFQGVEGGIQTLAPILPVGFAGGTTLWLASIPLTPGAPPEGKLALYRQLPGAGPVLISKVGSGTTFNEYPSFADIANDGSRVVFSSAEHLLPADAGRTEGESVYGWNGSSLRLLDVDSGGTLLSTCGVRISDANGMSVSADRVFFTTAPACGSPTKVYSANLVAGTTTEISATKCTRLDCNAEADASFVGATPDGDFAYLTTTQQLTNDDEDESRDLYRYNTGTGQLSLISGTFEPVSGEVVEQERVFPSEGGERVYFRATGEMTPGESTTGEKLFMADAGGIHLVAVAKFAAPVELQLSTTGKKALFVTATNIAAGDQDSQGDVYLYNADSGNLTWVSTGPSGGNAELPARIEAPAPISRYETQYGNTKLYRAIDGGGDRVFFQTDESLVPEDTNTTADVYELWNGDLGLISAGNQPQRADFAGVSKDGQTALFGTNASLVGRDNDGESRDLYAARVGGGFPEPPPPARGCDDATCPIPLSERRTLPTPPSLARSQGKGSALRVVEVASKAKKGAIAVVVSAPGPGLVSAQLSSEKKKGKKVILAAGSKRAKQAGKLELKLKLTSSARRLGTSAVSAQLTVSQGSSKVSQTVKVSLP